MRYKVPLQLVFLQKCHSLKSAGEETDLCFATAAKGRGIKKNCSKDVSGPQATTATHHTGFLNSLLSEPLLSGCVKLCNIALYPFTFSEKQNQVTQGSMRKKKDRKAHIPALL